MSDISRALMHRQFRRSLDWVQRTSDHTNPSLDRKITVSLSRSGKLRFDLTGSFTPTRFPRLLTAEPLRQPSRRIAYGVTKPQPTHFLPASG